MRARKSGSVRAQWSNPSRLRIGQMSGKEYVSLSISAPELGSKTLYANLGRAAGESDPNVYALIWNPRE
jgi:uncharacterized protein (DUF736 family)